MMKSAFGRMVPAASAVFSCLVLAAVAGAAESPHHPIHSAIYELKEARVEMKEAKHDFGGHRVEAIKAIDGAIVHLDKILAALGEKPIAIKANPDWYKKFEHHAHLHWAVHELREAHHHIKEAKFDYPERERALRDLDFAIKQIDICIAIADDMWKEHRHIQWALYELKEAHKEIAESKSDFGGHKEKALKAIDAAVTQVDKALTAAGIKFTGIKVEKEVYQKYASLPHLYHCLNELKEAHKQIKEAKHDFKGQREQTLKDVSYAIEQIDHCINMAMAAERLHFARHELKEAETEVKESKDDFGGHKSKALSAITAAIKQLDDCLKAIGDKSPAVKVDPKTYSKYDSHPHLQHSVGELAAAKSQIKATPHDFGGHKEQAVKDIDQAIAQIELCVNHVKTTAKTKPKGSGSKK